MLDPQKDARRRVLVVDDEPANRVLMEALLAPENVEILTAADGEEGLQTAMRERPDVILLDVMMPRMDGFEVARRLKTDEDTKVIPVVMVTSLQDVGDRVKALECGADDFLTKPVDKTEVRARVRSLLRVKASDDRMRDYQHELQAEVARQTLEIRRAYDKVKETSLETIHRLARAAEFRDEITGSHIERIGIYSGRLAGRLGMDEAECERIRYAAPMHDVGKIAVPDDVLRKPSALNDEEWAIMRKHTIWGKEILEGSSSEILQVAEIIALTHHEKWDGSGYPRQLTGEDIPLYGRIVAVVDVFDALTTRRPYKDPIPPEEAFEMVTGLRGTHFCPRTLDAFAAIHDEIIEIRREHAEEDSGPDAP